MPLHWTYPENFQINLYRSGWKNDRGFNRIVADIGKGKFEPVSKENMGFIIKANTINKVRPRDVSFLILTNENEASPIGPETKLQGIRLSRGDTLLGGISLFDDWQNAPITSSNWYEIPPAVEIPKGLVLIKGSRPTAAGAIHFTLGPAEEMTLRHFIVLLTPLANDSRIVKVE
ncbi:MAG: hypothetical protein L3J75_06905 [Methylococcaceae bacterium]|nr:hypothetical protein [Methylococcaceae bacterium]